MSLLDRLADGAARMYEKYCRTAERVQEYLPSREERPTPRPEEPIQDQFYRKRRTQEEIEEQIRKVSERLSQE